MRLLTMISLLFFAPAMLAYAQHPTMPAGMTHAQHLEQMKKEADLKQRGGLAMGFDQDQTAHHFLLTASGGIIQVVVNDAADAKSRDAIRSHLQEIAQSFARGEFDKPFATHNEVPPAVDTMQRLKSEIAYAFEATAAGGIVRITTTHNSAQQAIHDFLRYQIREHKTGDPLRVQK